MPEMQVTALYRDPEFTITREFIEEMCRENWKGSTIGLSFFQDTFECTISAIPGNDDTIVMMVNHFSISALTLDDKEVFDDIWDELQKYRGYFVFTVFHDISEEMRDRAIDLILAFHKKFDFTLWQEDDLGSFPNKKDLILWWQNKIGCLLPFLWICTVAAAILGLLVSVGPL